MSFVDRTMARAATLLALLGLLGAGCAPKAYDPEFYPALPAAPRLQLLKVYETEADLKRGLGSRLSGQSNELFARASDVALTPQGKLYVLDNFKLDVRLYEIDLRDNSRRIISLAETAKGAAGLCTDEAGSVYVADRYGSKVVRLALDGSTERRYQRTDQAGFGPASCTVTGGRLYASDLGSGQVVVFDVASAAQLAVWGTPPDNLFGFPIAISAGPGEGYFTLLDTLKGQVLRLDGEGKIVKTFGALGDAPGTFARPKGLAIDRNGLHYISDAIYSIVQVFDAEGSPRYFFGGQGEAGARGRLMLPAGVVIDYASAPLLQPLAAPGFTVEYLVVVASQGPPNQSTHKPKVLVYGYGRMAGHDYSGQ